MFLKPLRLTVLLTTALSPVVGFAAPEGGSVAYGDADIIQSGKVTNITQHTHRAVLDWQKFNLESDETADFTQPSKSSIAINRIHDVDPSVIRGHLKSTGTIVLSNSNGVMFTPEAAVDVGGIVASSATTSNQSALDFVEGRRHDVPLDVAGKATASVVNSGAITVKEAGIAAFVAPQVENSGAIQATKGKVQLASGDTATIDMYGDGLIKLAVSDSTEKQLVSNRGLIEADGGTVLLTAAAGEHVARGVITMDGVIQSRSVQEKNGKIILSADGLTANKGQKSGSGKVTISGTLDASGKNAGERGGSITITGEEITLKSTARLDASGHSGVSGTTTKTTRSIKRDGAAGGEIKIGGDYLGQGDTATAKTTIVEKGANISADSLGSGDAGRVIIWSDGDTTFSGDVFARALGSSGDGGFLETSGKQNLTANGNVNLTSLHGDTGLWLLDPSNITIYNRAYGGGIDNSNTFLTSYLETQSASADISLLASTDIDINLTGDTLTLANNRNLTLTTTSGNIQMSSDGRIVTSGTGGITFNAGADINLYSSTSSGIGFTSGSGGIQMLANRHILVSDADYNSGGGALIFNSNRGNAGGVISLKGVSAQSGGGNIILGGGLTPASGYALDFNGANSGNGITLSDGTNIVRGTSINAGGGNITMNGQGWADTSCTAYCHGISLASTTLTTNGSGSVTLNGIGGGTASSAPGSQSTANGAGVHSYARFNGNSTITAGTGGINITGQNTKLGAYTGSAVSLTSGALTSTGNIDITATNGTASGVITTTSGATLSGANITLTADDLVLGGNISGTGTLTLRPYSTNREMGINSNPYSGGSGLLLSTAEIALLQNGWSAINIGRSDSTVTMEIGASSWQDPVNFLNNYRTQINGDLTGTGNASFNVNAGASGWINFNGSATNTITTAGQNVTFSSGLGGSTNANATINTSGGNITFSTAGLSLPGTVSGNRTLTINAGTGSVTLPVISNSSPTYSPSLNITGSTINLTTFVNNPMGDITLNSVNNLSIPTITTRVGKSIDATVTGAGNSITTTGALTAGAAGNITLTADDLVLGGNLGGSGTLTLQPYAASRNVRVNRGTGDFNLSSAELGYLVNGWSGINVGNTAGSVDMHLGASTWYDPITFRNKYRISQYGDIAGVDNASINTSGAGGWFNVAYALTTQGQNITLGNQLGAYGGTINSSGGNINIYNIAASPTAGNGITIISGNGNINTGSLTDTVGGAGTAGKLLTFNAGTGTVGFSSTVNTAANISTIGNSITFNGAWGGTTPVGDVTLTSANSMSLPAITTAAGKAVNAAVTGAGNSITTTGAIATGAAGNITLTADDLAIGGNLSGTGTLTLQPTSTNRSVRVNSGSGDFNLSTAELAYLVDGWNTIGIGRNNTTASSSLGALTTSDPMIFYGRDININGNLTGVGDAGFTFSSATGGWTNFSTQASTVTTNGQNVTFAGNGGHYSLSQDATINTNNGNVTFTGSGSLFLSSASAGERTFNINAGTGSVTLPAVNNQHLSYLFNLLVNGGSLSLGTIGGSNNSGLGLGSVELTSANGVILPNITARSILARTTGSTSDITLTSGKVLTASGSGNALTLASGRNFINNSGAGALALAGTGRWLVYSANPTDTTGEQLLSSNFNRYSCAYATGATCASGSVLIPTSGNGLVYSYTPTLTATANGQTITYGAAVPALSNYGYSVSGYLGSDASADTLSGALTGSTNYTQGSNIGNYAINYSSGTLASALGYGVNYANSMSALTVNPRTLIATLTGTATKEYDRTQTATLSGSNYSLSNVYGSDNVVLNNPTSGTYDSVHAGTGKTISVSGLGISGTKSSNYTLASSSISGAIGEITAKALSVLGVTVNNKVYDKTTTATLNTSGASLSGVMSGDTITLDGTAVGAFANKNVADGKAVTVSGFTLAGSNTGDYTLTQPAGLTANITPRTVTANLIGAVSKIYDGTTAATLDSGNYSLSNVLSDDVVLLNYPISGNYATASAGTGKTVTVTGAGLLGSDAGNYQLSATTLSGYIGTINRKGLSVVADSGLQKTYGDADGTMSYGYSGLVTGETLANFSGALQRSAGENAGDYTITQGSLQATGNYIIDNYTSSVYRINKAPITITAPTINRTYGDANPTLDWSHASISGLKNSETGAVLDTLTFNIAAGATTTANAGTTHVTSLNSFSDNNYTLSSNTNGLLTITPRDITAAWNASLNKVYGDANPSVNTGNFTYTGLINGATNSAITATPDFGGVNANSNVGTYAVGASFSSTNYHVSNAPATLLQITPRPLTITTYDAIRSYGDSNAGITGSASGLTAYDDAQISWSYSPTTTARNAGTYTIGAIATDSSNRLGNYTRTNNYGTLTINPSMLYVSATNGTKTYGDADSALAYSFSNLKYDDNVSIFTGALQRAAGENVGSYTIDRGTLSANSNYVMSFTSGQYGIAPANLNIAANNASRLFGYQNPDLSATITGWKMSDQPSILSGLKLQTNAVISSPIGSYRIWASEAVAANYTINYIDGVMQVLPVGRIIPSTVERFTSLAPYKMHIEDKEFIDFKKPYTDTVVFDKIDSHYKSDDVRSNKPNEIGDNYPGIEFSDSVSSNLQKNTEAL